MRATPGIRTYDSTATVLAFPPAVEASAEMGNKPVAGWAVTIKNMRSR